MVRRRRRKQSQFYQDLLPEVEKLKAAHPAWGYRRITAFLKKYVHPRINHKGVELLMKNNGLQVPRRRRLRACRNDARPKPVTDIPNTIWGTDMTKIWTLSEGWCYIHVVLDWASKKLLALLASSRSSTKEWISALNMAVNLQYPNGIRQEDHYDPLPGIVSDNGCQPTSKAFHAFLKSLGLDHIRTSYNNPKGDADTERVIRTIKEDLLWTREFKTIAEVQSALDRWMHDYNNVFPHSSIANCTPVEYETRFLNGDAPTNTRASKIIEKKMKTPLFF